MSRILICSTDVFPRKALVRALTDAGIAQDIVETDSIDEVSDASDVSALVLDEPSPEQCRRASEIAPRVPVFILSAVPRTDEEAVVFVKPFGPPAFIGALIGAVSRFEQSDDAAVFIGRDVDDLETGHRRTGRIGTVCGIRNDDVDSLCIVSILVVLSYQQ